MSAFGTTFDPEKLIEFEDPPFTAEIAFASFVKHGLILRSVKP